MYEMRGAKSRVAEHPLAKPAAVAPKPVSPRPADQILKRQQTIGNRAVQRLIQAQAVAAPSKERVPTDWYLDFWGTGASRGVKARADRDEHDVLVLKDLTVGPEDDSKTFKNTGNARESGLSHVGQYDHPKGHGVLYGEVSYATQKELDVKLSWSDQKKGQTNLAAESAAKKAVEKLIYENTDLSGDWSAVEKQAATAAAEFLPEGSAPTVEIAWKGNHGQVPLDVVE